MDLSTACTRVSLVHGFNPASSAMASLRLPSTPHSQRGWPTRGKSNLGATRALLQQKHRPDWCRWCRNWSKTLGTCQAPAAPRSRNCGREFPPMRYHSHRPPSGSEPPIQPWKPCQFLQQESKACHYPSAFPRDKRGGSMAVGSRP